MSEQPCAMPPASTCAIDLMLDRVRQSLDRVRCEHLDEELADGALLVDTRPVEQQERFGAMPGAVVIDRNVLEWRLDPTSPYRIPGLTGPGTRVILVCQQGYSSSLAAVTLQELGLTRATDLVGGFEEWARFTETA